jgi:hypothetical protein
MNTRMALLKASIDADLGEIGKLYACLSDYSLPLKTPEHAILVGYYLHNLYTAFENISLNVAKAFENQIDDKSQWHFVLLKRMTLEIEGVRPKLYDSKTHECLDELRRFRHIFRNAYSISLDPDRVQLVLSVAERLKVLYNQDINQFKLFLESI